MLHGAKASGVLGLPTVSTWDSSKWVKVNVQNTDTVLGRGLKHEQLGNISWQAEKTGVRGHASTQSKGWVSIR